MMSASDDENILEVFRPADVCPTQSSRCFAFRSKLRLQMWLRCRPAGECSVRIRATELPTVPKPRMATFSGFCGAYSPWRQRRKWIGSWISNPSPLRPCRAGLPFRKPISIDLSPARRPRRWSDTRRAHLLSDRAIVFAELTAARLWPERNVVQAAHRTWNVAFLHYEADVNFRCALGNHANVDLRHSAMVLKTLAAMPGLP